MYSSLRLATRRPVHCRVRAPIIRSYSNDSWTSPVPAGDRDERRVWQGPIHDVATPEQKAALEDFKQTFTKSIDGLVERHPDQAGYGWQLKRRVQTILGDQQEPIRVAVSGAAGQIGYALLYRIACGDVFGPTVPVRLQLLELPQAQNALKGVEMELRDCAFPNLVDIVCTDDPHVAFEGVDYALLVGGQPRTKGMERADLLNKNAAIFSAQGKALNKAGKGKDTRVLVVGNPANTNAMIASRNAPNIPAINFSAMTKLDHNRALGQISSKIGVSVTNIHNFAIWGNHSATQFPSLLHCTIGNEKKPALEIINDDNWYKTVFTPCVQQRGAAVIAARGSSSAASAASSLIDGLRETHFGYNGWSSAGVVSNGEYGIEKGLFFSFPIQFKPKSWEIIAGLKFDEYSQRMIDTTHAELKGERDAVAAHLP